MNLNYDKESIQLPDSWRTKSWVLLALGLLCILIGVGLCFMTPATKGDQSLAFKYWTHSYLANLIFILTFALGALFFILIQFLTRAGWSSSIRRIAEINMTTLPLIAILFVPILGFLYSGSDALYEWNAPPSEIHSSVIKTKAEFFLTKEFFTVRTLVYLALWIWMATWFFSLSRKQDESGDTELSLVRQKWSGPLVMIFALSVSFATFDWVMSIDADWYSTILGVYLFAASMMGHFALMIVLCMSLQKAGKIKTFVTVEHFHDMGKFLFGFVMFWSYIAFSQLLLYWYGNIPEETNWYRVRLTDGWAYLSFGLIFLHFAIPFLGLMSRHVRRHRAGLAFWAVWILFAHWLDITYLVMPNAGPVAFFPMLGHLLGGVGMFSILGAFFLVRASNVPLVAVRDPRLPEALTYTNPLL